MTLFVQSSISRNIPQTEGAKDYQRHAVAQKFAVNLAKLIEDEKDYMISETSDDSMITTRYEIHVFSPEQLRQLIRDIEGKIRRGLPIIM